MSLRNQLLRYSLVLIGIFPGQATYSQTEGQLNPSDIGSSSLASSSNFNASTNSYHLSATGGQIWGSQDNFHFYNQAITGNVEVTVQVEALQSSGNKAKAGIMLRQSLDDDSIHAFLAASSGDKVALERRREIAGGTTRSGKGNIPVPVWLRLVRIGTYISSYYSTDGDKWEFLAEDTINFSSPIFVGMAISSELKNKTIEADFSDFTVVDLDQAPASETYVSSDIGKVVVNGVAVFDPEKESYLVEASGGDIGHTQDAFHYVYHELSGDFEGVVKLDSLVAQEDWAKAGLMIRADLHPQSQYFALFMAKNIGVVYQSRVTLGGESNWSKTDAIADPVWIKLTRTGNLFQAHYSLNGTDWILQDEITMAFPESVLFGMAVTSHQEGSLAYAEFSNLSDTASAAPADNTSTGGGTNTGGGSTPVDPVAGFSRVTSSGGDSLTIQVDGSSSISGDHPIVSYSWDWGDGSSNSSGVQATHTYQNAGVYMVVLTITDQSGASQRSSQPVQVTSGSLPSSEIQIVEKGYHHVRLRWADNQRWDAPWLIQRSTVSGFVDPTIMMNNQAEDNTSTGTFRWLGINATQYVDIDDLEEGLTYYYRVATCTNLSDHYQKGVKPQFSAWQYGQVTMGTLEASKKRTFDVTAYGAIANDGNNDYPAALAAFKAAQAAGGGQVYFPAGNWDLWPVDPGVSLVNGIPTLLSGQNASSRLFYVTADNITFKGAAANGNPTSFLKFYLWHKQPATKYMEVLSGGAGSSVKNVRRYFIFLMGNAKNFTLKDLDIDMGAV
ncbi:MAG: DUF1349 domain-containing protein, partial [Verrucomicrobiae bacterium]|nr:DUF1349 domain-containing protein [Verrucomicrobiae bacterium]